MGNLNSILEIGKKSLIANSEMLEVIGHNIANVNTEGYSRQRANLTTAFPMDNINYGQMGTGVLVESITRARDALIDKQVRIENNALGQWDKMNNALSEIQSVFAEPSDFGITDILSDFWNGWADLANDPESYGARTALRERAVVLTESLNNCDANLKLIEEQLNQEFKLLVGQLNEYGRQIAELNHKIGSAESVGQNANDFRDQRDLKLDKMAKIISIQYFENDNGSVNVYIGGNIFVQENAAHELTTRVSSRHGVVIDELIWKDGFREVNLTGGELKGLADARDIEAENIRNRMDDLALTIVSEVNQLHSAGYGLSGSTGINFFDEDTTGAGNIALNELILTDLNAIAAAKTSAPGDNSNALDIAALADARVMNNGNETFGQHFASTMSEIGARKVTAESYQEQYEAISIQMMNMRQSIQGVVMDEELTEMIKFQQAYGAAAHVVGVVNELMVTVINLGR